MLQIIFLTVASVAIFLPLVGFVAQRLLYPGVALMQVVTYPLVTVLAQGLAYLLILVFMISIVKRVARPEFLGGNPLELAAKLDSLFAGWRAAGSCAARDRALPSHAKRIAHGPLFSHGR